MSEKNEELLTVTISHELAGLRLDKALAQHEQIRTRSRAAKLINAKKVMKKGVQVKASTLVEADEIYEVFLPKMRSDRLEPYHLNLEIIFEDENLIVINKPSGLVVHPAHGHEQETLVNALIAQCKNLSMGFAEKRPGIVHRLDKDTSGLMVVAKNDFAHENLALQFKNKAVTRRYKCLCYGVPTKDRDRIESYLIRHPVHRKNFCSEKFTNRTKARGKWSATHYEVMAQFKEHICLIYCRLETGRTHQIRVHLSELGHPIINDPIYLKATRMRSIRSKELINVIRGTQRLTLHAFELGFVHPKTQQKLYFKKDWPDDLLTMVDFLGFKDL